MKTEPYSKMAADIYDAGNIHKDYKTESSILKEIITKYKQSNSNELLDVGCGTGLHLPYLIDEYAVTGVDISEKQLEGARKRLPGVTFIRGDMRDFTLRHKFDVVSCLFSGIGYVYPYEQMEKAIVNMSDHLKPGGILIVEPWLQPGTFKPNQPTQTYVANLPNTNIKMTVIISDFRLNGNISSMKMHHILENPGGTEEFTEEHSMALYKPQEFRKAFKVAELSMLLHDKQGLDGRGLFIARKSINK